MFLLKKTERRNSNIVLQLIITRVTSFVNLSSLSIRKKIVYLIMVWIFLKKEGMGQGLVTAMSVKIEKTKNNRCSNNIYPLRPLLSSVYYGEQETLARQSPSFFSSSSSSSFFTIRAWVGRTSLKRKKILGACLIREELMVPHCDYYSGRY